MRTKRVLPENMAVRVIRTATKNNTQDFLDYLSFYILPTRVMGNARSLIVTKSKNPFDADFAREMFEYNPETGIVTRKMARQSALIGKRIGNHDSRGYLRFQFLWWGQKYNVAVHRLGWLIYHGEWPKDQLDHINGIRDDNRLCNLREATQAQNNANTRMYKNNSSGYKNIKWEPDRQRYGVFIRYDNKLHRLGRFKTLEEAISVRNAKYEEIYGDFTRYE